MKSLLHILGFILLTISCQAYAAKTDLDDKSDKFADVYTFSLPVSIGNSNQSQTYLVTIDQIRNFASLWDDLSLKTTRKASNKDKGNSDKLVEALIANLSVLSTPSIMPGGVVVGDAATAQVTSGSTNTPTSQPPVVSNLPTATTPAAPIVLSTPIPAAIWLFGAALLGLVGVKKRVRA